MRVPVLAYAVTGLMLSAFPYKSVVVGEGDKIVTIITALASAALIALAMMMTTRTRTTSDTSGQDGFTTADADGSSFEVEAAGAESAAASQTASGAEVAGQHTSGTASKQTNE